mmetsp:Transcript_26929/g.50305  ORF Transcript_26929/g.50305 Transcript_26929/m.50305 type:complete len:767 (+) Transcript_26929:20-2320(+)
MDVTIENNQAPKPDVEVPAANLKTPSPRKAKRRVSRENVDVILHSESKEDDTDANVVQFVPPAEGTPAAQALRANADIKVTRIEKGFRRIKGIKHPKAKNITKFMKRKKDKSRAFSRNFKGKVIDGVHELYTITAGMMLGLRVAVGRSNIASEHDLLLGDFSYVEKINFPPHGNNQPPFRTPPHQLAHTFKFKTYAPLVFSKLRDFFGVDSMSYMLSVCGNYNYLEFISNSKSGQFFFYSHDGRYMIKTQTNEENKFMKRILPHYYRYVTENPHTFLVRIYGMHRVKMYHLHRKTHFVIMQSVFDTPEPIQKIFDLKGSVTGRNATQKERDNGGVLKDNDLIGDGVKLQLGSKRDAILEQLEKDANFLAELNIMDYSVLLGIHDRKTRKPSEVEANQSARVGMSSKKKSRSILPFRLNEQKHVSGSSIGESGSVSFENAVVSQRSPTKKRASTFDSKDDVTFSEDNKAVPKRGSCPTSLSSNTVGECVDDVVDDEYSDSENEDYESDEEDDEFDDHYDAGDSDLSVETTAEASNLVQENLRNVSSNISGDGDDGLKNNDGLTGINLTDVNLSAVNETANGVMGKFSKGAGSNYSSSLHATVGAPTVGTFTDTSAYGSDDDEEGVGIGLAGEEGKAISKLFKDNVDLSAVASAGNRMSMGHNGSASPSPGRSVMHVNSRTMTFGPGSTRHHPWTGRYDGGINSRLSDGTRGDYIYYIGVIDILQQYNAAKRFETVFKGITHEKSDISSVDSVSYAKRFVKFMTDNTV